MCVIKILKQTHSSLCSNSCRGKLPYRFFQAVGRRSSVGIPVQSLKNFSLGDTMDKDEQKLESFNFDQAKSNSKSPETKL